jgi:hypothetical protein
MGTSWFPSSAGAGAPAALLLLAVFGQVSSQCPPWNPDCGFIPTGGGRCPPWNPNCVGILGDYDDWGIFPPVDVPIGIHGDYDDWGIFPPVDVPIGIHDDGNIIHRYTCTYILVHIKFHFANTSTSI